MQIRTKKISIFYAVLMLVIAIVSGLFGLFHEEGVSLKETLFFVGMWLFGNLCVLGFILEGKINLMASPDDEKSINTNPVWFWGLLFCIFFPVNYLPFI